jgi:hypothetical protein
MLSFVFGSSNAMYRSKLEPNAAQSKPEPSVYGQLYY